MLGRVLKISRWDRVQTIFSIFRESIDHRFYFLEGGVLTFSRVKNLLKAVGGWGIMKW